jgi:hypothetical protein
MEPSGRWLVAPELVGSQSGNRENKVQSYPVGDIAHCKFVREVRHKAGDYVSEVGSSEQVTSHSINLIA